MRASVILLVAMGLFGIAAATARADEATPSPTAFVGTPDSLTNDVVEALLLDSAGDILATGATRAGPTDWRLWLGRIVG